ncbi:MAG: Rid family hydrolase [Pirellulales bacterium]
MTEKLTKTMLPARRDLMGAALLGAASGTFLGPLASAGATEQGESKSFRRKALRPAGAPSADVGYSPAILSTGQQMLFISGQGPKDYSADMEIQIRQTFDRIGLLLEAAGASFANVVILRSYWVHMLRDLPLYRKVRKDYLVEPYPASTAVGTPELAIPGLELEIEAIAVI